MDLGCLTRSVGHRANLGKCQHLRVRAPESVRRSVTIDWTVRENARAQIRVIVKRILRKYGYPRDKQEEATLTVLEQAEVLCKDWTGIAA